MKNINYKITKRTVDLLNDLSASLSDKVSVLHSNKMRVLSLVNVGSGTPEILGAELKSQINKSYYGGHQR